MKISRLVSGLLFSLPIAACAQGFLESPVANATESGLGVVSGWHCTAKQITAFVDGVALGESGVGSLRADTRNICGHANTGFSLLYNYNIPEQGEHEIEVYADGVLLDRRKFKTVRPGGTPFLAGKTATATVPNFPEQGKASTLEWSQAKQSFVLTGSVDTTTLNGTYTLRRVSAQTQNFGLLDTSDSHTLTASGTMTISGEHYRQSISMRIGNSSTSVPIDVTGYLQDKGHYLYDRANGNQLIVVDRGASTITSILYHDSLLGWTNEIHYWSKIN
ncbi:hypothetical protein [Thauera butanivorans]|uniref:hypothetical protein n=1 Tax=Thauera butanivorans TaxID=86174 RepID=UPI0008396704|nr:hypothetical protein [Thauera butanivorans]